MTPEIKNRIDQMRQGEVPEGYKYSTLGIIPAEWEIHTISQHLSESCIPGNSGNTAKKITVKLWSKGVVEKQENHQGSVNTQYYRRKEGQFIYSKLDFLNCAFGIIPPKLDGYESTQDLPAFDIEGIDPHYLLLQVIQRRFYEHWGIMAANGGRKARRISPDDFLTFPIAFPYLNEQQKISKILIAQEKVIELKEKLITEKQRQKKYLMQQLLTGRKRLAGYSKKWCVVKLKNIAKKEKLKNVGFEYSLVLSNSAQHGIIPQEEQFDKEIASASRIDEYYIVRDGYFVYNPRISTTAPCGPININETGHTGIMSPLYTVFSINCDYIDNSYMKQYFKSTCWFQHMKSVANYGARHDRMSITDDDFFAMPIAVPELEEQQAISAVFAVADKEISLLQQSLEKEKQKKKALMQLLLTGIVRVGL